MPAAIAWRLRERMPLTRTLCGRACCMLLVVAGVVVGAVSTVTTVLEIARGAHKFTDVCSVNGSQYEA